MKGVSAACQAACVHRVRGHGSGAVKRQRKVRPSLKLPLLSLRPFLAPPRPLPPLRRLPRPRPPPTLLRPGRPPPPPPPPTPLLRPCAPSSRPRPRLADPSRSYVPKPLPSSLLPLPRPPSALSLCSAHLYSQGAAAVRPVFSPRSGPGAQMLRLGQRPAWRQVRACPCQQPGTMQRWRHCLAASALLLPWTRFPCQDRCLHDPQHARAAHESRL